MVAFNVITGNVEDDVSAYSVLVSSLEVRGRLFMVFFAIF